MTFKTALLATALAAAALPASATTLVTSLTAFQAGVTGRITSTPNPGSFDLTQLFLPTTTTIALNDGATLNLAAAAQVTRPQNGFPYLLSSGFAGELFLPVDASGNQLSSETIRFSSAVTALGFEVAPFSSAAGEPNFGVRGGPFTVTLTLATGLTQTVSLPGANGSGVTTPQFFGFYGGGVTSLTLATSDPNGFAFGNFVDVPEPASAALLLVGLAGLVRRRITVA